jgi:hypothetical protein
MYYTAALRDTEAVNRFNQFIECAPAVNYYRNICFNSILKLKFKYLTLKRE